MTVTRAIIVLGLVNALVLLLVLCSMATPAMAIDGINIIEEWNRTFGGTSDDYGYSIQQTTDGGYIIAGYTYSYSAGSADVWLIKTNPDGIEEWNRTFGGAEADLLDRGSVQQTSDGGYIVTGYTYSYGAGDADVWLIKSEPNGIEEWNRTFGGEHKDWGHSVQQTSESGYIIAGRTDPYAGASADAWLIKTDSNGVEEWNRTFGTEACEYAASVQQTSDGGYIIAGRTSSYDAGVVDAWLIKTDSNGTAKWNRTFGGAYYDYGYSVQQTADGGYIMVGSTNNRQDIWLIKTDADGIEEWNSIFGGIAMDEGYSVQQTADGGYIVAGYTASYGAGSGDVWLIKTDSNGNEQWNKTFGGAELEKGYSVQQTTDGGYIVAGFTNSYGAGYANAWLIKLSVQTLSQPDLIITKIDAYHNRTIYPPYFNLSNEVDVTVRNIGNATSAPSKLSLFADDVPIGTIDVPGIDAGNLTTVQFEWTPIGYDCEDGGNPVTYTLEAIADCDNVLNELNETNNNLTAAEATYWAGYSSDEIFEEAFHDVLRGGLLFTTGDGEYSTLYSPGDTATIHYDITTLLPEGAVVKLARLNVYYTWSRTKMYPEMEISITNATGTYVVPLDKSYNDRPCTSPAIAFEYPWGNYIYDITSYIQGRGTYTVTVKNSGTSDKPSNFCIDPPGMVILYEDSTKPLSEVWILEGADLLEGGRRGGAGNLALRECINNATFKVKGSIDIDTVSRATLGVVSPWGGAGWAPGMTNYLYFNDIMLGAGVYHGYSERYSKTIDSITMHVGSMNAQMGVNVTDVSSSLAASENIVGQGDDGDSMMPCNAFLVVEYKEERPPTPFFISGWVENSNGEVVNNPKVTIANLNTSEAFIAETKPGSNYYQVLISSRNVSAGDILHFCVSNAYTAEFNHAVTEEEMNNGGFEQNITITFPFDTGPGDYPSIMGVHNGTITPYTNISVNKIYTYPCAGTGGHTEYVKIWIAQNNSSSWNVTATWEGYVDDWHNITFEMPFTLEAGVEYNYTIKTGSYPQIIHKPRLETKEGEITCLQFEDANAKIYHDWIPAIKLIGTETSPHTCEDLGNL